MEPISGSISALWLVFSLSFLVALTGALSPGPLLTYTLIQTARAKRRGYLTGLWVIAGHAILESVIICGLILGFSAVLNNQTVVRVIGSAGGLLLVLFGLGIIRDVMKGKISTHFLDTGHTPGGDTDTAPPPGLNNPVVGGVLISMANPYWWVWWATVGLAFMVEFDISVENWPRLLAFFLGHEAGDLLWYFLVSTLAFFGLQHLNRKTYCGILACCGLFMIGFGVYLAVSLYFQNT
jgi:threonine/homoserine/homoserine lactone efflux protein